MEARKLSSEAPPFQLSLRIRHPSMDPATFSRDLAIQAEHSFRAGDARQSRSGLVTAAVHAETYWLATLNPESWLADIAFPARPKLAQAQERMDEALTRSLGWALSSSATRLRSRHAALLQQVGATGGQVSLLIALSAVAVGSFSLTPEVGRIFSELGIILEFEFTND
jgi:hypothetical protein